MAISKTKINRIANLGIFTIFFLAGFLFLEIEKTNAETKGICETKEQDCTTAAPECIPLKKESGITEENCKGSWCTANSPSKTCSWQSTEENKQEWQQLQEVRQDYQNNQDICDWGEWLSSNFFKCILLVLLRFMGTLLSVAATLFAWIIDPNNFTSIMSNSVIYETWTLVRDTLNVAFILVLLFSAFATVFQVSKYGYKNVLWNVILMALLVNFSYPITRFFIDVGNSLMYYMLNNLSFGGSKDAIFATIANGGANGNVGYLQKILGVGASTTDTSYLIAANIVVFILAVTFLAIAVLLVIRNVALALLVIFSPVAFIGAAVPGKLGGHAGKWWSSLFEYAFFGPSMIFMLYVATKMVGMMGSAGGNLKTIAGEQSANPDIIASISFFALPIVILWLGIGMAKSSSVAGSNAVMGWAQKWADKAMRSPYRVPMWISKKSGVTGAAQYKYGEFKKKGWFSADAQKKREEWLSTKGPLSGDLSGFDAKKVKEAADGKEVSTMDLNVLRQLADNTKENKHTRMAAILELANRGKANANDMSQTRALFGSDSQVTRQLQSKIKNYNPLAAFATSVRRDPTTGKYVVDSFDEDKFNGFITSNQFKVKDISAEALKNTRAMELMLKNESINHKDIVDLKNKGKEYSDALKDRFKDLVNTGLYSSQTDETHKLIQKAYTTMTGEIGDTNFREHIYSTGDKDSLGGLQASAMTDSDMNLMAEYIKPGKLQDIMKAMSSETQSKFKGHVESQTYTSANAKNIKNAIDKDPYIKNIVT